MNSLMNMVRATGNEQMNQVSNISSKNHFGIF